MTNRCSALSHLVGLLTLANDFGVGFWKTCSDFVTNSSSSSFVLGMKSRELNEKQKEVLLDYICSTFLGENVDSNEIEELKKDYSGKYYADKAERLKSAIDGGFDIFQGSVSYEEAEYHLAHMYSDIWNLIEKYSDGNFVQVDTDLSY